MAASGPLGKVIQLAKLTGEKGHCYQYCFQQRDGRECCLPVKASTLKGCLPLPWDRTQPGLQKFINPGRRARLACLLCCLLQLTCRASTDHLHPYHPKPKSVREDLLTMPHQNGSPGQILCSRSLENKSNTEPSCLWDFMSSKTDS